MNSVILCNSCGGWQPYTGKKSLRFVDFKCLRCGKSTSVFDKRKGCWRLVVVDKDKFERDTKTNVSLPTLVSLLNTVKK